MSKIISEAFGFHVPDDARLTAYVCEVTGICTVQSGKYGYGTNFRIAGHQNLLEAVMAASRQTSELEAVETVAHRTVAEAAGDGTDCGCGPAGSMETMENRSEHGTA